MEQEKHLLNKEIKMPFSKGLRVKLREYSQRAAFCGIAIYLTIPAIILIYALIIGSIDKVVMLHTRLYSAFAYPIGGVLFLASFVFRFISADGLGKKQFGLKRHLAFILMLCCGILMIVAQLTNGAEYFVDGYTPRNESLLSQLNSFLLLFPAASLIIDAKKKRILIRLHIVISIFMFCAAFILRSHLTESALFDDWRPQFSAIYTNTNYYGYYLALTAPLCAATLCGEERLCWKIVSAIALLCCGVAVAINDTMGAIVACIAGMIFVIVTQCVVKKKLDYFAIAACVVFFAPLIITSSVLNNTAKNVSQLTADIGAIVTQPQSAAAASAGSSRWGIWRRCLQLIKQNPVFGIGMEGIVAKEAVSFVGNTRPHNEFLQYALFYGIPAAVFYATGCFGVFLRGARKRKMIDAETLTALSAAFGYLVSSFFGNTIYCTAPLLFIFLGMGYQRAEKGE